jgi:Na+/melibiose symporter-like transporter
MNMYAKILKKRLANKVQYHSKNNTRGSRIYFKNTRLIRVGALLFVMYFYISCFLTSITKYFTKINLRKEGCVYSGL